MHVPRCSCRRKLHMSHSDFLSGFVRRNKNLVIYKKEIINFNELSQPGYTGYWLSRFSARLTVQTETPDRSPAEEARLPQCASGYTSAWCSSNNICFVNRSILLFPIPSRMVCKARRDLFNPSCWLPRPRPRQNVI